MNTTNTRGRLPLRTGDRVRTRPHSGDNLVGRVNTVYEIQNSKLKIKNYYRVKFPPGSPYFNDDDGVVYRDHELELHADPPETNTVKLPKRPQPFHR